MGGVKCAMSRSHRDSYGLVHLYWKENIMLLYYNCLMYLHIVISKSMFSYAVVGKSKLGTNCLIGNFLSLNLEPAVQLIPSHFYNVLFFNNIMLSHN